MFDVCREDRALQSLAEAAARSNCSAFDPANPRVPVTQKVLDADDYAAMIEAVLDGHLTSGPRTDAFEAALAGVFGLRCAAFVNSGSSANLLALAALMDESLGDARLKPGDEVVTCATGFPTTVNLIVQLGMVPVFVDAEIGTYNANMGTLSEACKREQVKAVILAHTLGNPIDFAELYDDNDSWLIEDGCDALGSKLGGLKLIGRHVGAVGDLTTCSFYPAHHITSIEGGAVVTNSPNLDAIVRSLRDWGRECWCPTGKDNTCGKRFSWRFDDFGQGRLPDGYDHKHVFARLGYNLKGDDVRAALGASQLKKLPQFSEARKRNFARLYAALENLQDFIILPQATPNSVPSWFGFPITIAGFNPDDRRNVVAYLESKGCATRPIFAGNIVRQPYMRNIKYEVVGDLTNSDTIMRQSFYVGIHPGLGDEHIDYLGKCIREAVTR